MGGVVDQTQEVLHRLLSPDEDVSGGRHFEKASLCWIQEYFSLRAGR